MRRSCVRRGVLLLLVLLVFAGCQTAMQEAPMEAEQPQAEKAELVSHTLTILHTNDHHGHPVAFFDYPADGQGGLPAQATFVQAVRATEENVLVLSAGDINTGRPESNFFNAEPDIIGMNYIGYDAMTMGNHEFDPSYEKMQEQIALSEFPWLCANVLTSEGKLIDNVKPYIIKDYGPFKVAILGLLDAGTAQTGNPANIAGLTFADEVMTARKYMKELESKADLVIALVHMGLYESEDEGSKRLAAEVSGIDMIIDGHTHTKTLTPEYVTNLETGYEVPIVQARHWGLYMGRIDVTFTSEEVEEFLFGLIPINVQYREKLDDGSTVFHYEDQEIPEDQGLLSLLTPYVEQVDAVLNEEIGVATAPFLNADTRKRETAIGNIVADSMAWFCNEMNLEVDFAFQNGGGIRTDIADGPILKRTIYEVLPFDNSVAVVSLTGADVIALFERTVETIGQGAMPQVSGEVSYRIDTENGLIDELLIAGEPVDPDREYRIATNSYLAASGDGYEIFANGYDYYDTSLMQRDAFIEYVQYLGGTITPKVEGRIIIE